MISHEEDVHDQKSQIKDIRGVPQTMIKTNRQAILDFFGVFY